MNSFLGVSMSVVVTLTIGQTIQVRLNQTSGADINTEANAGATWLTIDRIA